MGIIFIDGFDTYDTTIFHSGKAGWTPSYPDTNYLVIQTTDPRFGVGRYYANYGEGGNWRAAYRALPANYSTLMIQFGYWEISSNNCYVMGFQDGSTMQVLLWLASDRLYAYRGEKVTLLETASQATAPGVWHQLEIKIVFKSTAAGSFLVKQDGVTVINQTNIITAPSGNEYTNYLMTGVNCSTIGYSGGSRWDDMICMDTTGSYCNDLLGIRQVKACMPTANGNYAQWTPSAGSNWQNVDEIPPNEDTDYNSISAAGSKDTFVVPDVSSGAVVDAVVIDLYAKTADPAAVTLKGLARSNSTDGEGSVVTVPSSYAYLQSVIYRDPNGNIAWNGASFNAAEFGYKKET